MSRRVTVVFCVCMSVCPFLTSGVSVRPENTLMYSAGNGGQKICGFFFENASLKSCGVKGKRKSYLDRTYIFWLIRDQVFLFDVQRSTRGYCMRECKHAYCSSLSYSASSSVQNQLELLSWNSMCAFQHSRMRVIYAEGSALQCIHYSWTSECIIVTMQRSKKDIQTRLQ